MAVIKQTHAESEVAAAGKPVMEDLDSKVQQMIDAARATAESIIHAAKAEAGQLNEAARQSGFEEGRAAGRAEGRAEALQETTDRVQRTCEAWTGMLERWEQDRATQLRQAEEDLIGTAVLLAESVVHRAIEVDATIVQGSLRAALEMVRRPTDVVVHVHPDDHDFVSEILGAITSTISACNSASVRTEESIDRGGCRLELDGGSIDATVATQLDQIASVLLPTAEADRE